MTLTVDRATSLLAGAAIFDGPCCCERSGFAMMVLVLTPDEYRSNYLQVVLLRVLRETRGR